MALSIEAQTRVFPIPKESVQTGLKDPNKVTLGELDQEISIFETCGDPHALRFGHVFISALRELPDGTREEIYSYVPKTTRELVMEGIEVIDNPVKAKPTEMEKIKKMLVAEGIWEA